MIIEKVSAKSIKEAIKILKSGGVIAYPTETSYGLGCDAKNKKAIKRIFVIKNRPYEKNLPIICSSKKQIEENFYVTKKVWDIWKNATRPTSIILRARFAKIEVPVRISSEKIARVLSRGLRGPITATSANLSKENPIYNGQEIFAKFSKKKYKPDYIIDAGKLKKNRVSTIIKLEEKKIKVIRK